MMYARRVISLIMLGACAVTIAACGGDDDDTTSAAANDGGQETATVRFLSPVPSGESSFMYPTYVGEVLGYFEEEGIELEVEGAGGQLPLPAFVSNGDADVGAASADETISAVSEGSDLKVTYDYWTRTGDLIVVPDDSEITETSQFEGGTIGVAGPEDRLFARTALEAAGVDPNSVRMPQVGQAGPGVVSALRSGEIDGYAAGGSQTATIEATLPLRVVLPEEVEGRPSISLISTSEYIEANSDVLNRFLRAWAKATYAGIVSPEAVMVMARERLPIEFENPEVGESIVNTAVESQTPDEGDQFGQIREQAWAQVEQGMIDEGQLRRPIDLDAMFDQQFIGAANDWDRAEVERDVRNWLEQNG